MCARLAVLTLQSGPGSLCGFSGGSDGRDCLPEGDYDLTARILIIDLETTRAVVESFNLFPNYIHIDRVKMPSRILCFAAQWRGETKPIFKAAWKDGDEVAYLDMMESAYNLLNEADFIVTWNGDRFDLQWLEAEFARLGLGRPAPYRSIDLFKIAKKHFGKGLMSLKLDWSARQFLGDRKQSHDGLDLWDEIRYGNRDERRAAQKIMKTYNIQDTKLTSDLLERFLPWIGENFALYDSDADDGAIRCNKCSSENVQRRGYFPTKTAMYPRWRCNDCGSWSRGRRMAYTTELRIV